MRFIEEILKDSRYAVRQLRRTPGLKLAVVLCLALGIGANTAIFAAIDAVMLRALPVKEPQNLFMLTWSSQGHPHRFVSDILGGGPVLDPGIGGRAQRRNPRFFICNIPRKPHSQLLYNIRSGRK